MSEYIEREELMKQVRLMASRSSLGETKPDSLSGLEVVGLILDAPAADVVKRKRGEWKYKSTYYEIDECNCSLCGQLMTTAIGKRMNFCPNCGADMRRVDHVE